MSTGEIDREIALNIIKQPTADPKMISEDKAYLLKKFRLSEVDFENIMSSPIKNIHDYPNNHFIEKIFRKTLHYFRKTKFLPN